MIIQPNIINWMIPEICPEKVQRQIDSKVTLINKSFKPNITRIANVLCGRASTSARVLQTSLPITATNQKSMIIMILVLPLIKFMLMPNKIPSAAVPPAHPVGSSSPGACQVEAGVRNIEPFSSFSFHSVTVRSCQICVHIW